MNQAEVNAYLNIEGGAPIRIVEDGAVRTIVESCLIYNATTLRILFGINKADGAVELNYEINSSEKDKIFRIELTPAASGGIIAGTCFGEEKIEPDGKEQIAQDYLTYMVGDKSFGMIHFGNYGVRYDGKMLSLTLAQFPAYAGHPIPNRPLLRTTRYVERIDQGITTGKYVFLFGEEKKLTDEMAYCNSVYKQSAEALNFFPIKTEGTVQTLVSLNNPSVIMSACFYDGDAIFFRLFNSSDSAAECTLFSTFLKIEEKIKFNAYEFITLKYAGNKLIYVDLSKKESYTAKGDLK